MAPRVRAAATQLVAFELYALTHEDMRIRAARFNAVTYESMEAWAKALGAEILGPQEVEVDPGGGPILKRLELASREAVTTPIMPGELTVAARVRVTFAFKP